MKHDVCRYLIGTHRNRVGIDGIRAGGEEKKIPLQNLSRAEAKTLSGSHTFFLEEYGLKPGDFVSYYAKARDAQNETTSDIYFIEVKPFEKEFRQGQQQ